jgi:hypothetical protein
MIFVSVAQSVKSPRIVTDNDRVHALSHGDLPSIVFTQALGSTTLA